MCEPEHWGSSNNKARSRDFKKIRFMKGLPQGDSLCPRFFTLAEPSSVAPAGNGGIPVIQDHSELAINFRGFKEEKRVSCDNL